MVQAGRSGSYSKLSGSLPVRCDLKILAIFYEAALYITQEGW